MFKYLKLFVENPKIIILAYTLFAGVGAAGGYFASNMSQQAQVMVSEQPVPMVIKPLCDENTVARICGKVIRKHETSILH